MPFSIFNKMEGDIRVLSTDKRDITFDMMQGVQSYQELEADIQRIRNRVSGKIDVVKLPSITTKTIPTYDTFVRKSIPTYTYNRNHSLIVGNSYNNDAFESYVKFDVNIPYLSVVDGAKLILTKLNQDTAFNFELRAIDKDWQDNNVTWLSKPTIGRTLSTGVVTNNGLTVEFDLTQYYKDMKAGLIDDKGFTIVSTDNACTTFYSKEGLYPPVIQLDYIDTSAKSIGTSTMPIETVLNFRGSSNSIEFEGEVKHINETKLSESTFELSLAKKQEFMQFDCSIVRSSSIEFEMTLKYEAETAIDFDMSLAKKQEFVQFDSIIRRVSYSEFEMSLIKIANVDCDFEMSLIKNGSSERQFDMKRAVVSEREFESTIVRLDQVDSEFELSLAKKQEFINFDCNLIMKSEQEFDYGLYMIKSNECQFDMSLAFSQSVDTLLEMKIGKASFVEFEAISGIKSECVFETFLKDFNDIEFEAITSLSNDYIFDMTLHGKSECEFECDVKSPDSIIFDSMLGLSLYNKFESMLAIKDEKEFESVIFSSTTQEFESIRSLPSDIEFEVNVRFPFECELEAITAFENSHEFESFVNFLGISEIDVEALRGYSSESVFEGVISFASDMQFESVIARVATAPELEGMLGHTSSIEFESLRGNSTNVEFESKLAVASQSPEFEVIRSLSDDIEFESVKSFAVACEFDSKLGKQSFSPDFECMLAEAGDIQFESITAHKLYQTLEMYLRVYSECEFEGEIVDELSAFDAYSFIIE